ncbi:MFS transporter [Nonomuraea sp. LPB2021202275-12-8]|uniref:MFS transporter n=1 Tax=Nonomuraea sp. LPB2021202275-12-8 TaxID=3120159 RepID=UPI00300CF0E0
MTAITDHGRLAARRRGLALAVLAGALALDLSGLGVLNAALPVIEDQFGLDSATLQWAMTAYAVTFAGFLLFGGRVADVYGRRLVFAVGVVLFSAAALAGALAPDFSVLIVARAAQGVGAALSGPAALALLMECFPEGPVRNRALGIYAAVGAASFSGGMLLGGMLTQNFGWRSVLVFSAVFGVVVLGATRAGLPGGKGHRGSLDLPGVVSVTAGLVLMVFAASRGGETGWSETGTLGALAAAVISLVMFALWERRAREPLLPPVIFRVASVRAAALTAFLQYASSVGLLFFAPLYLQGMLGYSPLLSGLSVIPMSLTVFLTANFCTGRLLGKFGTRPLMISGLVLMGVGPLLWMWTPLDGTYWLHALPGFVLSGIGQGLAFPAMTSAALTGVDQRQHGVAGALNTIAQQIGASVGVAALVMIATAAAGEGQAGLLSGYHMAYLTAAAACLLGVLIIAITRPWNGEK